MGPGVWQPFQTEPAQQEPMESGRLLRVQQQGPVDRLGELQILSGPEYQPDGALSVRRRLSTRQRPIGY